MAYTTSTAVRTAIEVLITGLSPAGTAYGRGGYRKASPGFSWADRPDSDIDREFTVETIEESVPTMFGAVAEIDYEGSVDVVIGHVITTDREKGLDRCNTDINQIRSQMEKTANLPTGVWMIRYDGMTQDEKEKHWITTLRFLLLYSRAAP